MQGPHTCNHSRDSIPALRGVMQWYEPLCHHAARNYGVKIENLDWRGSESKSLMFLYMFWQGPSYLSLKKQDKLPHQPPLMGSVFFILPLVWCPDITWCPQCPDSWTVQTRRLAFHGTPSWLVLWRYAPRLAPSYWEWVGWACCLIKPLQAQAISTSSPWREERKG